MTSDAFEPDEGDVNRAILASTATTVAVFLPLGMIGGIVGQAFLPFALTVTFALAASYFVVPTVYSLVDQFGRQFSARFRRRATAPVTSD